MLLINPWDSKTKRESKMKRKLLLVALTSILVVGCSKLTKENYDALKMGMAKSEIEAIIGKADNCSETLGTLSCLWGSEDSKNVKITFMADKAVTFSYEGLE